MDTEQIPAELKPIPQWVFHRDKAPYDLRQLRTSVTGNGDYWTTFDDAYEQAEPNGFDGIGFVLTKSDPYCVIDLDNCVDTKTGEIAGLAQEIVTDLDSYTELSPSGTGLHIWVKASLDGRIGHKSADFEIYDSARYMTVTGNPIPDSPTEINERQSEVDALHERVFGVPDDTESRPRPALNLDDREVIERCQSEYADFSQLFDDGAWSGHPSQSEADFRLCCIFAEVCGDDPGQIDRLFRGSKLMRKKWDSKRGTSTYGKTTVLNAIRATLAG